MKSYYSNYSRYHIYKDGVIQNIKTGRLLSQHKCRSGYLRVWMVNDSGKRKALLVHRLVASFYVENPQEYYEVNHIDGFKDNNHFSNLEWCTHSYNCTHREKLKKCHAKGK